MNYEVLKELRDERRRRHMGRGGKINPTPQYRKPHRESVGEEEEEIETRGEYISESEKVVERGSVGERKITLKFEKGENRGVKRKLNEEIWTLWLDGTKQKYIALKLRINEKTVYRHLVEYGNLKTGEVKKDYVS